MKSTDVTWVQPPSHRLSDVLDRLGRHLRGRVREAYVFGSYARGDATKDSDLDLILVADTTAPWPERARPFLDLQDLGLPVDILVYTPGEWAAMERERHPLLATRSEWVPIVRQDEGPKGARASAARKQTRRYRGTRRKRRSS